MLRLIFVYLPLTTALLTAGVFAPANAATISNDRVFAYAEGKYPNLFPSTAADLQFEQFTYRYYPTTANYLAVDTANVIFRLGPDTGNKLTSIAPVAAYADAIIAWEALTINTYSSLATPLLNYIAADQSVTTTSSSTLNTRIILGADYYSTTPEIITANYGFEGYMGVPNLGGTGSSAQTAAYAGNVSYENIDLSLQATATAKAYYAASGSQGFLTTYGVSATAADTIPVVFSHPIWPPSVTPTAFQVTMNTGVVVTPLVASFYQTQNTTRGKQLF